jgi:arsenite methyltransferase
MQEQAIKEKVKERYGKIALTGNSESCCAPGIEYFHISE